ncbi:hypothetical protein Ddye_031224 [Dipteronia dyeriana]|uniref:NHL repeat-containing protein n=1 Tax=Dipteronia dyeriana TaxID=168575 RepID=A0AAD9TII7_9ROSI|nr:hypothetical protein Ddye_031224 [Dipteronia dyeriana]
MSSLSILFFSSFLLFNLVSSKLLLEDGYTVTTVVDGHKLNINPWLVISPPGSSDLVVLDSSGSRFYTLTLPLSKESVAKLLSGDGVVGHSDGEPGSARFNKPKNFAVDFKGNVYVADKNNNAIRKITNSGVTTIAGGKSKKPGRQDGPAQNASFSDDFELTFVPGICALLVSDHGNTLVRQINLKAEDCARGSQSGLGAASIWALGLLFSCLLGLVIGIVIRPYIFRHEDPNHFRFSVTWRHYLIHLAKQVLKLCFDIRSVIVSSTPYAFLRRLFWMSLSHLSLMFGIHFLESKNSRNDVSLLDSDNLHGLLDSDNLHVGLHDSDNLHGCEIKKSQIYADQLKDLITFDGLKQGHENQEISDVLSDSHGKLDDMIQANVKGLRGAAEGEIPLDESIIDSSGLVKRRK